MKRRYFVRDSLAASVGVSGIVPWMELTAQSQADHRVFQYSVAIVGSPTTPDVLWSDEQLRAIKQVGFNTLQLSIAWASKPAAEVLNLEDLEKPENAREWHRRIAKAKEVGFRHPVAAWTGAELAAQPRVLVIGVDHHIIDGAELLEKPPKQTRVVRPDLRIENTRRRIRSGSDGKSKVRERFAGSLDGIPGRDGRSRSERQAGSPAVVGTMGAFRRSNIRNHRTDSPRSFWFDPS